MAAGTETNASRAVRSAFPIRRSLRAAAAWLRLCLARHRERRDLAELPDERLPDLGLTRAEVARECRRWAWDGGRREAR